VSSQSATADGSTDEVGRGINLKMSRYLDLAKI
jgi:hypothetical protein